MSNSPNHLPYNSYDESLKNLVLDQSAINSSIYIFLYSHHFSQYCIANEILSWSLIGVKDLTFLMVLL